MKNNQPQPRSLSAIQTFFCTKNTNFRPQRLKTQYTPSFPRQNSNVAKSFARNDSQPNTKLTLKKYFKDPEEVYEENLNLKAVINDLRNQLALQRGHMEMNKKKTSIISKQLARQFEKELYYSDNNPNSYMISGVKHQYEQIKQLYEQKCMANEELTKRIQSTDIEQMKVYINALEVQNVELKQKLSNFLNDRKPFDERNGVKVHNQFINFNQKSYADLQLKNLNSQQQEQKLNILERCHTADLNNIVNKFVAEKKKNTVANSCLQRYRQKCQKLLNYLQQNQKKITFLQKKLVEKDNNAHQSKRQLIKAQRKIRGHQHQNNRLKNSIKENEQTYIKHISILNQRKAEKHEGQQQMFEKKLQQKNAIICKLQKQIRYLSTLLSCWKPLDDNFTSKNIFKGDQIILKCQQHQVQAQMQIENKNKSINQLDVTVLNYCLPINKDDREEDMIRRRMTGIQYQKKNNSSLLTYQLFIQNSY